MLVGRKIVHFFLMKKLTKTLIFVDQLFHSFFSFTIIRRLKDERFFIFSSLLLFLVLQSCMPEQETKKAVGACGEGEAFDAKSRSCYNIRGQPAVPVNTLRVVNLTEDTPQLIELTYTDTNGDYATSCSISQTGFGVSLGACSCVGGYCSVVITPAVDFFGVSDFTYFVQDQTGPSRPSVVRVNVSSADDAPVITGTDPASTITFAEEASQIIELLYSDNESGLASSCEVSLSTNSYASISSACSCSTSTGECFVSLTGKTDIPETTVAVTSTFSYRLRVDGAWSDYATATYSITSVNDLPYPDTSSSATVPVPINEDDPPFTVYLPYFEADTETPFTCELVSTASVTAVGACTCNPIAPGDRTGNCSIDLQVTADVNKNSGMPIGFTYRFQDFDAVTWGPTSSTLSLTVEPVNDAPVLTSTPSASPYTDDEDTIITVDSNFFADEGGGVDEDVQALTILAQSDNQTLLPNQNITIKYGGTSIGTGGASRLLGDGILSSDLSEITFDLKPNRDQSGTATVTVEVSDDEFPPLTSTFSFDVTFNPISDNPTIRNYPKVCAYDSYEDAPDCGTNGCVGNTPPASTATRYGQLYFNYSSGLCYVSTNSWTPMATVCPVTKAEVETGCASIDFDGDLAADDPLNCVGLDSPVGTITPIQAGSYYYDLTNDLCYLSTAAGDAQAWTAVDLTEPSYVCNFNQSGASSPLGSVSPTSTGAIYFDTSEEICYHATGSSSTSWTSFETTCPLSPKSDEANCPNLNCLGTNPPRGNAIPAQDITPTGVDHYYYEYDANICYRSIKTAAGSTQWAIFGAGFADMKGNESGVNSGVGIGPIIRKDLILDEGGDASENAQTLNQLIISNLTSSNSATYPGNSSLLSATTGIRVYQNGVQLSAATTAHSLTVANLDAGNAKDDYYEIHFIPNAGEYGRSEMKVELIDSSGGSQVEYFSLIVYPIGVNHNGWEKIIATGNKINKFGTNLKKIAVNLKWSSFGVSAANDVQDPVVDATRTDFSTVGVKGYHVFRRQPGENYNYSYPLNGSTIIDKSVREFTDTEGTTNKIPGPPQPGKVYYYKVVAVDTYNEFLIHPAQKVNKLRVIAPPDNMAFVHQWMVNREVCSKMNLTSNGSKNFRCQYQGVGAVYDSTSTDDPPYYYDIENDLLVDLHEAGCPYSDVNDTVNCGGAACIGLDEPTVPGAVPQPLTVDEALYYSRSSGTCYEFANSLTWEAIGVSTTSTLNQTQALKTQLAQLPPLVNVKQEYANTICDTRGTLSIQTSTSATSTAATDQFKLPSRKEQIAYSAWSSGTGFSAFEIDTLETGLSLNSSAKCNASYASGLESSYTDSDIPTAGERFSLPGSNSSNIRSLFTSSNQTNLCVSRYGVQDSIGNVREWVEDRIYCYDGYRCYGVYDNMKGTQCPFTTAEEASNIAGNECNLDAGCIGSGAPTSIDASSNTSLVKGVVYLDSTNDTCYVSTASSTWVDLTEDLRHCPVSRTSVETGCTSSELGTAGVNCIGLESPVGLFDPTRVDSYYYDMNNRRCWRSALDTGTGDLEWEDVTACPVSTNAATACTGATLEGNGTYCVGNTSSSSVTASAVGIFYYDRDDNICFRSSAAGITWVNWTSTYPGAPARTPPAALNNNNDMKVADTYYFSYALDGVRGPCVDGDSNGACDDTFLSNWLFADESFDAGQFFFPLALPVHNDFSQNYPTSDVVNYLREIGPSFGITASNLHNDGITINAANIFNYDPNYCGAMTTGGSFISGSAAGRYEAEFLPCEEGSGSNNAYSVSADIGFRCVVPVSSGFYYQDTLP